MGNLTIRELATNLNISKEAIYRKINISMKEELKKHIQKIEGKTYISDLGQSIILQSLKRESDEVKIVQNEVLTEEIVSNNNVINTEFVINADYIEHLKKEIELLQTQYENEVNNNRRERETLYQLNQSLIDTFQNEQRIKVVSTFQLQDKQNIQPETETNINQTAKEQKQSFFRNLFKK